MKKLLLASVMLVLVLSVAFSAGAQKAQAGNPNLLEFNTMVAVIKPYTGTANPIRGINGGGVPWVISSGKGELSVTGNLEVTVTGLVLAVNNTNPIAQFKAIVSCQSVDASGAAVVVNLTTAAFPATTGLASAGGGDAKIETQVALPHPCIAPIVFVTSPGGNWFAATGN